MSICFNTLSVQSDKNRDELIRLNVMESVNMLVTSPTEVLRSVGTCLLATLVKTSEGRKAARKMSPSAIETLSHLLAPTETPVIRENTAFVPICMIVWTIP